MACSCYCNCLPEISIRHQRYIRHKYITCTEVVNISAKKDNLLLRAMGLFLLSQKRSSAIKIAAVLIAEIIIASDIIAASEFIGREDLASDGACTHVRISTCIFVAQTTRVSCLWLWTYIVWCEIAIQSPVGLKGICAMHTCIYIASLGIKFPTLVGW